MKVRRTILAPILAGALAVLAPAGRASADEVKIPYAMSRLDNGLTVILHEDHALPIVVVNVSYKVGSRFEQEHRSGFAHLFEHLMFMGTRRAPTKMFDAWMEQSGGWNNAWTNNDRTDYFDVAPPGTLPLLLWLEADRLRDLGTFMTKEKLDAQRDVVRNERRQSFENRPYGKVELRIPELLYPANHPYHHNTIGSHEDLEAASVTDVKDFFATWYDPANASLVVAGDFDVNATLKQIKEQFGAIPSRGVPKDPGAPGFDDQKTTMTAAVRETMEDHVELPKVFMAWQAPKSFSKGDAELDLVGSILSSGKASRLYQALVYEQKIAQSVEAGMESGALGSRFQINVTARPGVSLDKLEAAIDKELARVRNEPVKAEELERARNGVVTGFVRRLESVRERASILNAYFAQVGDPGYVAKDLARYEKATAEQIRDAAAKYLDPNTRVVLRVIPKPEAAK